MTVCNVGTKLLFTLENSIFYGLLKSRSYDIQSTLSSVTKNSNTFKDLLGQLHTF